MEKLLLCLNLAGNELDIVHQQDIRLPVLLPELRVPVLPDGADQLIGKIIALDVHDAGSGPPVPHQMGDGIQ